MQFSWADLPRPFTTLAPMEEVTDTVFRRIVADCGRPDVFFTEFTSVEGLCSPGKEAVAHRLQFTPEEQPVIAQIWGTTPEYYERAAKMIRKMGFAGIDINMGCPVSKIIKKGACSGLIRNQSLAAEIIQATKEGANDLPVSVKTRIGFSAIETDTWIPFLLEQKLAALTVHGRIAKELSKFPANWEEIAKVVQYRNQIAPETIIIGNGDVETLAEVEQKHQQYGVDGVMIGRGVFHNIFVFNKEQKHIDQLSPQEKVDLLLKHTRLYTQTWGTTKAFAPLKRFYKIYINGFEGAAELRAQLMQTKNVSEVEAITKQAATMV